MKQPLASGADGEGVSDSETSQGGESGADNVVVLHMIMVGTG